MLNVSCDLFLAAWGRES